MSEWKSFKLACLLETIQSGCRPKGGIDNESGDIPSFGGENIKREGGVIYEEAKKVTHAFTRDHSGKIRVTFPYEPEFVVKVKTIPGHRWHPAEKYSSFPNSDGILKRILKVFENDKEPIGYFGPEGRE